MGEMQSAVKRYYNINKILMSKLGIWPTQSKFMKILLPTVTTSFLFCIGFFEFVRLSETWETVMEDCECFIIVLISIGGYIKLFVIVLRNKNVERLLSLIDYHWRIFTHSLEIQIMHKYAIIGRKMAITYAVMNLMVIIDSIYMVFAQHACGLFAAVGHRLENLTSEISPKKSNRLIEDVEVTCKKRESKNHDDETYRELILILQKRQLSIQYVHMLDSLFALSSFFLLFITIIVMSLLGIQILALMDRKEDMVRYLAMVGSFMHLFILSYPGQRIMDHSADIFHKAYNMLWYRMSRRTTRLLNILLYRGLVPCTLTAGKIYVLSMANYASMMQAAVSYFALSSFR